MRRRNPLRLPGLNTEMLIRLRQVYLGYEDFIWWRIGLSEPVRS
jgi:hypothetical protein